MRLLLITNVFPNPYQPNRGIFNWNMARALARDHEVRVISPISWVEELREKRRGLALMNEDRSETREGIFIAYPRFYYPPKILRTRYGWLLWKSVKPAVRRMLRRFSPDVVLGYWEHPDGEVAVRVARLVGVPAVVISGGSAVLVLAKNPRRRRCVAKVLKAADAVVAVTQDLKNRIIDFGIPAEKVQVVSRGVDDKLFSPGSRIEARQRLNIPEGRMLLWVGRMVPVKGLDLLVKACDSLRQRGVSFRLYLLGDGPLRKELEYDCQGRGLSKCVIFVGSVPHDQLPDWYRSADVMVLPSRSEGVPNVLRESLACGTPFVASQVGGIPEIAGSCSRNLLFPAGDSNALAESIVAAFGEQSLSPIQVQASISWADSAEALMKVIRPLVATAPRTTNGEARKIKPAPAEYQVSGSGSRLRQLVRYGMAATLPRHLFLASGSSRCHSVCLTFDDGPHPEHTPRLLDVLKEQRVQATVFVVGREAVRYPEIVRRIRA
jgi:glycosyltransferase involved in cell wall biosynthesis